MTNLHGGGQQIWTPGQIAPSVTTVTVSPDILCTCLRDRAVTLLVVRRSFTATLGSCRSERHTMSDRRDLSLRSIVRDEARELDVSGYSRPRAGRVHRTP